MGLFSNIFSYVDPIASKILNKDKEEKKQQQESQQMIESTRTAFDTGSAIGEQKAQELYGDTEQYKGALADVLARQKQYFEKGADFEQRYSQQRQQDVQGRQLRGQQAASGVRGGLASAQRMNLSSQNQLEREAMDAAVRRQALADYEAMVGRRTSSIQGLPLAYGGLYSGQEANAQSMAIASKPQRKGVISDLLGGIL